MGLTDYSMMDKEFYLAGIQAEQERIMNLLTGGSEAEGPTTRFGNRISDCEFKLADGNDVIDVYTAWAAFEEQIRYYLELIKGEK